MLTTQIAEMLQTQPTVTAQDVATYSGCSMKAAHHALAYMTGIVRVRRGVYACAPGVTLRVASRADELLACLPATSAVLGCELNCSRAYVYNLIGRLRASGVAIVRAKGVYDVG